MKTISECKLLPTLKFGDTGSDVKILQSLLQSRGFFNGRIGGNFQTMTDKSVKYWQQTHVGPDKKFLVVDGVVGPNTWYSLYNPDGEAQKNNIKGVIPNGLSEDRQKFLTTCLAEHALGVAESPLGSNYGDGVTKYVEGFGPVYWCCLFISWCFHKTFGKYQLDKRFAGCADFWNTAKKHGRAFNKESHNPIPGDIFIMLFRNSNGRLTGMGHTGVVLSVSKDNNYFNTIEGNASDRVKIGTRSITQSTLVGFINMFDGLRDFEHVLLDAEDADTSVTGTR